MGPVASAEQRVVDRPPGQADRARRRRAGGRARARARGRAGRRRARPARRRRAGARRGRAGSGERDGLGVPHGACLPESGARCNRVSSAAQERSRIGPAAGGAAGRGVRRGGDEVARRRGSSGDDRGACGRQLKRSGGRRRRRRGSAGPRRRAVRRGAPVDVALEVRDGVAAEAAWRSGRARSATTATPEPASSSRSASVIPSSANFVAT